MNIGFWLCGVLVIPFVIIGVLFAIFKMNRHNGIMVNHIILHLMMFRSYLIRSILFLIPVKTIIAGQLLKRHPVSV